MGAAVPALDSLTQKRQFDSACAPKEARYRGKKENRIGQTFLKRYTQPKRGAADYRLCRKRGSSKANTYTSIGGIGKALELTGEEAVSLRRFYSEENKVARFGSAPIQRSSNAAVGSPKPT